MIPSLIAVVFVEPASLPACGSVRPKADNISPESIFECFFKLELPYKRIGKVPSDVCADIVITTRHPPSLIQYASALDTISRPDPPYSVEH